MRSRRIALVIAAALLAALLGRPIPASAAFTVTNIGKTTCALGATCNFVLSITPTVGDVLIMTSMTINSSGNVLHPVPGQCGGTQTWNASPTFQVNDGATHTTALFVDNAVVAAASTTCNTTQSTSGTGSIQVYDVSGGNSSSLPTSLYDIGGAATAAWGVNLSSSTTGILSPILFTGEYPFCVFGSSTSVSGGSFSGGALTWTTSLNDSSLGSSDTSFATVYLSSSPMQCTYSYTGSVTTGGMFIFLLPVVPAVPIKSPPWIGA